MTPRRPRNLPDPPEPARESRLARLRRRGRRKLLRGFDYAINALYRAISWLDRRAPIERRYFRVAIFGSSRILPEDDNYRRVCALARRLSYMGCDIVTGGGPGLMMAANEGARSGAYRYRTRSFGLAILLPLEEQPNPFLDEVAHHKSFFSRLHQFIRLSHAYVVVDGGIGTTLEAMMVWQLLQVRVIGERPLVFVGPMWKGLRDWVAGEIVARGLASPRDVELVHWVDDVDEAVEIVRRARDGFLARHEVQLPPAAGDDEAAGGPEVGCEPPTAAEAEAVAAEVGAEPGSVAAAKEEAADEAGATRAGAGP
ncbi:MAG TPA: LOG family protein [Thermoanaerobaculia bacterium]|nr:LOG family protein [Thermoanaerobaculia bacterium]